MKIIYSKKSNEVIQFKINLKGGKPAIWRRFLIEKDIFFDEFHDVIQAVMGWENCHLYEFKVENYTISQINDDFDDFNDSIDSTKITLAEVFKKEKQKIIYTYDFGDSWTHEILVENFLEKEINSIYPVCLKGKNNCPPEDCGGIWGYQELLETIMDTNNPDREEVLEWIGEDFDPLHFDIEEINNRLQ